MGNDAKYNQQYYEAHREEISDKHAVYYLSHKSEARQQSNQYRRQLRVRVLEFLGDKCIRCGFDDERALQVDHKEGGGNQERATTEKYTFYNQILISRDILNVN